MKKLMIILVSLRLGIADASAIYITVSPSDRTTIINGTMTVSVTSFSSWFDHDKVNTSITYHSRKYGTAVLQKKEGDNWYDVPNTSFDVSSEGQTKIYTLPTSSEGTFTYRIHQRCVVTVYWGAVVLGIGILHEDETNHAYSAEFTVAVNKPLPLIGGGIIPTSGNVSGYFQNSFAFCNNVSSVTFVSTDNATGGDGNYTYKWYVSDSEYGGNPQVINSNTTELTYYAFEKYYWRVVTDGLGNTAQSNKIHVSKYAEVNAGTIVGGPSFHSTEFSACAEIPFRISNGSFPSGGYPYPTSTSDFTRIEEFYDISWILASDTFNPATYTTLPDKSLSISLSLPEGTHYVQRVARNQCGEAKTNWVTINVVPSIPEGFALSAWNGNTVCFDGEGGKPGVIECSYPTGIDAASAYLYEFKWWMSDDDVNWSNAGTNDGISSGNGLTKIAVNSILPANQWKKYFRASVRSNVCPDFNAYSQTIVFNKNEPLNMEDSISIIENKDRIVCMNGNPGRFEVTNVPANGVGGWQFQWQKDTINRSTRQWSGWKDIKIWEPYNPTHPEFGGYYRDANNSYYDNIQDTITQTARYRRVAINRCGTFTPSVEYNKKQIAVIEVRQPFTDNDVMIEKDQYILKNATPNTLIGRATSERVMNGNISGINPTSNITYQWYSSSNPDDWDYGPTKTGNALILENGTGQNYSFGSNRISGDIYFKRITTGSCYSKESNIVGIQVVNGVVGGTIGSDATVCYGNVPNRLTGIALTGGANYQWQISSTAGYTKEWTDLKENATNDDYQPSALTETTFFRRKTTMGSVSEFSNFVTINVTGQLPTIRNFKEAYCYDMDTRLEANFQSGYSYSWTDKYGHLLKDGYLYEISNLKSPFTIRLVSYNNQYDCYQSNEYDIAVEQVKADFKASKTYVDLNGGVQLTNLSTGATKYEWDFDEGEGSYATNLTYYFNQPGKHTIKLTAESANGCKDEKVMKDYITVADYVGYNGGLTGVDVDEKNAVSLYPNPVSDVLNLNFGKKFSGTIEILSVTGQSMLKKKVDTELESIDVAFLQSGVYIVKIVENTEVVNIKFVKQ